jgi:hypothetical protein
MILLLLLLLLVLLVQLSCTATVLQQNMLSAKGPGCPA